MWRPQLLVKLVTMWGPAVVKQCLVQHGANWLTLPLQACIWFDLYWIVCFVWHITSSHYSSSRPFSPNQFSRKKKEVIIIISIIAFENTKMQSWASLQYCNSKNEKFPCLCACLKYEPHFTSILHQDYSINNGRMKIRKLGLKYSNK